MREFKADINDIVNEYKNLNEDIMKDDNLTDGEVLDLIYNYVEDLTEYEILTNPILNDLIKILKDNDTGIYHN